MNANFEAIQAAVNNNNARIESMQQPTKAVFQGFSTDTVRGDQGLVNLQQACHNYLAGSHICNTTEFAASPFKASAVETMTGFSAWILLDAVSMSGSTLSTKHGTDVYQGYSTCEGWKASDGRGQIIIANGSYSYGFCQDARKVACCK
jgi:hypothetical protein